MHRAKILRPQGDDADVKVTSIELFFDLVYVFTIIELENELYANLTLLGLLETAVLFLGVWWAWINTTWAANVIDPRRGPAVVMMSGLTLASLVMSSAIPQAFGHRGPTFAIAYVIIQLGRSAFMVWVLGSDSTEGRNYVQLLTWSAIAGVAWVGGAFIEDPHTRLVVWTGAVVLDLTAPLHGYWLPRKGSTPPRAWTLLGEHLAERCQLILMIAFGETLLSLGETFTEHRGATGVATAFSAGFVLTFALWALYFLRHAERGAAVMTKQPHRAAEIGRSGYAYAHAVMVSGLIVIAVGIKLSVSAPTESGLAASLCCLGGPALYLLGILLYREAIDDQRLGPSLAGLAALVLLGIPAALFERLTGLVVAAVIAAALSVSSFRERATAVPGG